MCRPCGFFLWGGFPIRRPLCRPGWFTYPLVEGILPSLNPRGDRTLLPALVLLTPVVKEFRHLRVASVTGGNQGGASLRSHVFLLLAS